jgi:short-subunit dehydrogenase
MDYALITGASSGIGNALARIFAEAKYNLILVARREDRLKHLAEELEDDYEVKAHVLSRDLSKPQSVKEIYEWVKKNDLRVDILVNNAGFVVYGKISDTPWDDEHKMMQLHMHASTHLIKLFLPDMLKTKSGKILNIGSTGSFVPGPNAAFYCATKSFMLSLSEAIGEELRGTGVTVTTLCPGGTKTEFAEKAIRKNGSTAKSKGMEAEKVARIAYRSLFRGRRVVVPGLLNKLQVLAIRFLPRIVVVRLTGIMMLKHK